MKSKNKLPYCPVATTIELIGNKWKLLILRNLMTRPWRFNELKKNLDGISQKVLTDNLRQLEADGIIYRKDYNTNPPKVEYGVTELAKRLQQLLCAMEEFGNFYNSLF